jgi:CRP-like cAMP-binding protein
VQLTEKQISLLQNAFKPINIAIENHPHFFSSWESVEFNRNEFITEAGATEKYFYVVEEGIQTIYILDLDGKTQVIGFSFDGSFTGVYDSFLHQQPSAYFLESLTPTKLLRINKENYDKLFTLYPEFEHWGRIVHGELLIGRVNREIELTTLTTAERFERFEKRCPEPLKQIPQKYLASYLNMTPETYSRLRRKKFIS